METPTLAARLARYAHALRYEDLPPDTVHEAKRRFIDALGCAVGAYDSPPARIARRVASTVASTCPATVLGANCRAAPDWAGFANGVQIRYLDFNDTYLSLEPAHPSDNLAAALAACEVAGAHGRDLIVAAVLAYEVQCRLCDAASLRSRGWDHVTYGAFSATLAAGKLMGLDEGQLVHAQGIAGTTGSAMRQTRVGELSMWKGCAFAAASRNAVFAAQLAREGMTGPSPVFEGEMGFQRQVSGPFDLDVAGFGGDGRPFMLHRTYIKLYPVEYHAQSAVDAALALRPEIGTVEDVAAITIDTFDAAADIIGGEAEKWRPRSRETADHSLPYCVAVALADGQVGPAQFDERRFTDRELLDLVGRTAVVRDPVLNAGYPEGIPNRVTVSTRSGGEHVAEVRFPRGHARNPMSDAEVEGKFRSLAGPVLPQPRIREALDRLWHLENESDIASVLSLLAVT